MSTDLVRVSCEAGSGSGNKPEAGGSLIKELVHTLQMTGPCPLKDTHVAVSGGGVVSNHRERQLSVCYHSCLVTERN